MKKIITLFATLLFTTALYAQSTDSLSDRARKYDQRYQLQTLSQKLVDNRGDGYENLYGVRNFRQVLRGVLYRGGANNKYNKYGKRANQNPLPNIGLKNLCNQGFGATVYLYDTNFSSAPQQVNCNTIESKSNTLTYLQMTAADVNNTSKYLQMIYNAIKGTGTSPLYMHCWNGWHASGLVSSLALRQFCGMSGKDALAYWMKNTDGNTEGYDTIKKRIVDFQPMSKFMISAEEQRQICL